MRFSYQNTANIAQDEIAKVAKELAPYLDILKSASQDSSHSTPESSLFLANDSLLREQVHALVDDKKSEHLKAEMVVGIGGSSLGAQAVFQAVGPNNGRVPLFFYDTVNERTLSEGIDQIKKITSAGGRVVIIIISKSGTTMETLANAAVLLSTLQSTVKDWQKQVIVISEPESALSLWAKKAGVIVAPHLAQVGGRFSIMSVVGLLPLALAGIDIKELHAGAREALSLCLSDKPDKNIALQSVAAIYKNWKDNKTIHDLFLFHQDLEGLGKWHRQLVAESLGKDGKGITPTVSIGSNDLHSMAQLYLAGPVDKFTTFVSVKTIDEHTVLAVDETFDAITTNIVGRSTSDIIKAIYKGTIGAYQQRKMPFVEIELADLSAHELGAFMQFKMIETMLLARLMHVNCFDQPAVEEYKTITRQILAK